MAAEAAAAISDPMIITDKSIPIFPRRFTLVPPLVVGLHGGCKPAASGSMKNSAVLFDDGNLNVVAAGEGELKPSRE